MAVTLSGIARVNRSTGQWKLIADISAFLKANPTKYESADDFEPDGTLYSMLAADGVLYAAEPLQTDTTADWVAPL